MGNGWAKLYRELLDKPIWINSTPEQKTVLITILLLANHSSNKWEWKGDIYEVKAGQFITSQDSLAEKCGKGITRQNVRTALNRFEKLGFLTIEPTNKSTLITIVNWGVYQLDNQQPNQQPNHKLTSAQPATNQQLTTNKKDKKDNNDKNKDIIVSIIDYLNGKTGKSYKPTSKAATLNITARIKDGYSEDDFKKVVDNKVVSWTNTDYEKFLRPETLFGNKMDSYLNESCRETKPTAENKLDDWITGGI